MELQQKNLEFKSFILLLPNFYHGHVKYLKKRPCKHGL